MQRVLIFGLGNLYKEKETYIQTHYEIAGYLDNKAAQIRKDSQDIWKNDPERIVCTPREAEEILEQDMQIILLSYQFPAMWKQLYELGIDQDRIVFGVALPPFHQDEEELFPSGQLEAAGAEIIYRSAAGKTYPVQSYEQLREIAKEVRRERVRKENPLIDMIAGMPCEPLSRLFGTDRGTSVDRYYIERFLEQNKDLIYGSCMEIAEDTYTMRYGGEHVDKAYILHVEGIGQNAIKGDLATGEGIFEDRYDCAIITQTLMFIFDIQNAAKNIYRMLKKGGTALITVSGISQVSRYDADRWGSCYGFHVDAMRKLFVPLFGEENVEISSHGNVKTAAALLYGLCCEDLQEEDFAGDDDDYPVIISAVLKKK